MNIDLEKIIAHLNSSADWIGLRYILEKNQTHNFRDAQPQYHGKRISRGVMVEVLVEGQMGYCATNRLDFDSIQRAVYHAQQQARAAKRWGIFTFDRDKIRPPRQGVYQSSRVKPLDTLTIKDINDLLVQVCHGLKVSSSVVKTTALAMVTEVDHYFVSSNGANIYQQFSMVSTDYSAVAMDGNIVQKRSDNGMLARCYQGGAEIINPALILQRAQEIGESAIALTQAQECPNTKTTLVLAPDQMMLQIHESVGHPLELDRILGDERNYAGSSFVKLEDFGNLAYGSPKMNITFDPTYAGELASYGFDDTGIEAQKQYLIQDGILLRGLGSLESQSRAKVEGVANSRACSWNRPPIDRMANLNLESGNESFQQLISTIEHGIYMESNRSWSIDDYRNKFQFGCEYARLIEHGQLTKTLRNPNYRGVTQHFWHNLTSVGDESTKDVFGTPICGKGEPNQMIRVGHASPVCVFNNIEVFGSV
ncbi:TldD/PmbA family protein [Cyanobacterium stanieri LEGE 03274]|uniref:TldD/PmbA family protein n=1 Tax=Cyanobacterium stanieri LEGE 03274 TaxID=1828756 RepID=A0ABR9V5G2_9CHRO|nr:TldD/PmbA family protein [Cyanobacterium stanieri]MBE9223130.1 TldD/PmbA family protein [Cyanobacterium stanieri LEGE 03274]